MSPSDQAGKQSLRIPQNELTRALELHRRYVTGLRGGARANFSAKNLSGSNLAECNLSSVIAPGADFSHCSLVCTDFSHADLYGARFAAADCTKTNFYRADLRGARLNGARSANRTRAVAGLFHEAAAARRRSYRPDAGRSTRRSERT